MVFKVFKVACGYYDIPDLKKDSTLKAAKTRVYRRIISIFAIGG